MLNHVEHNNELILLKNMFADLMIVGKMCLYNEHIYLHFVTYSFEFDDNIFY
jgi:hypothetical protein